MTYPGRRQFVLALGMSVAASLTGSLAARAGLSRRTQALLALTPPQLKNPKNPGFAVFMHLSRLVTCRAELDEGMGRRIFALFQAEPWGKKHMTTAYRELTGALAASVGPASVPELIAAGALGKGESWFASHVLTTWVLGIYYHESRAPERVAFAEALMWEAVEGLMEPPGYSTGEPGYWAEMPPGAKAGAGQ